MDQLIDEGLKVDMILCDLPYGTTKCKWDIVIPFEELWDRYSKIIKQDGAIVLFGRQPFFTDLINSNKKDFRYEIIWDKNTATDFAQANNKPLTVHENIAVFYKKKPTYNRIDDTGFKAYTDNRTTKKNSELGANGCTDREPVKDKTTRCPTTIRRYFPDNKKGKSYHPCQKPIDLLIWLIESFTERGQIILDNTMGSGSTGVACIKTERDFIGIELNKEYFDVAEKRINEEVIKRN